MSMSGTEALGSLLAGSGGVLAPGVSDALTARLAERAGARMLYLSGATVSAVRLGLPDLGYVGFADLAARAEEVLAASGLPLMVDADTGFGSPLQVTESVRRLERMGVAAVQIEDQVFPKRCGAIAGKAVVSLEEAVGRVRAAVSARDRMLVVARTDVLAFEGLEGVVRRCEAFVAAGCDLVFPAGLTTVAEVEAVARAVEVPLVFNCTEAAKVERWPTVEELADAGAPITIMPVTALVSAARELARTYARMVGEGTGAARDPKDWDDLNADLDLPRLLLEESGSAGHREDGRSSR